MQIPTIPDVLATVDAFCLRHDMAPTRFGREATGEPQLIDSMRNKGRVPSLTVLQKMADFMRRYDEEAPAPSTGQNDEMSRQAVQG
jgi:hypothetical protein